MSAEHPEEYPSQAIARDPWTRVWRGLASPYTAALWSALLAGCLLLRALVPQMPAEIAVDPAAISRWMANLPAGLRAQAAWMHALGIFSVAQAPWFRALLALTAWGILIALADAVWAIWRFWRAGERPAEQRTRARREWRRPGTAEELQEAVERVRQELIVRRYLVFHVSGEREAELRAIPWPAGVAAHLGALVILLALAFNAGWGWRIPELALAPGEEISLGRGDYSLRVEHLQSQGGDKASPAEQVMVFQRGRPVFQGILTEGAPTARHLALSIRLQTLGPLVRVAGTAPDGTPARLEAHPRVGEAGTSLNLAFAPGQSERYFRSLATGNVFRLQLADGNVHLEAYRAGETMPVVQRDWEGRGAVELDGERLFFEPYHYVVLGVQYAPANGMLWGGALLAAAGILLSLMAPAGWQCWRFHLVRNALVVQWEGSAADEEHGRWLDTLKVL
ncbi:MAG: cytochrome c biogenesis protein ResB [Anaerolineae bacterium]